MRGPNFLSLGMIDDDGSGQIIPRPHTTDLPPKGSDLWKGNPRLFQENLGW